MLLRDVPVDPQPPEARDWLIDELAKPVYQAARPTLFDRIAKAISDWLDSLSFGQLQGAPALGIGIVVALLAIGIVVAFIIFGLPRLNRRSTVAGALFGEDDQRSAQRIRADADAAAAAGDYTLAVAEAFRAIARGLAERAIVTAFPGTTAHEFGDRAGVAFPDRAQQLADAAVAFDGVRYLGETGTAERFAAVAALETALRTAKPVLQTASA